MTFAGEQSLPRLPSRGKSDDRARLDFRTDDLTKFLKKNCCLCDESVLIELESSASKFLTQLDSCSESSKRPARSFGSASGSDQDARSESNDE